MTKLALMACAWSCLAAMVSAAAPVLLLPDLDQPAATGTRPAASASAAANPDSATPAATGPDPATPAAPHPAAAAKSAAASAGAADSDDQKPAAEPSAGDGPTDAERRSRFATVESEVASFALVGQKVWHVLRISDLDVVIAADGTRFMPLLRIVKAMQLEKSEEGDRITFQPEGATAVAIDLARKELTIGGRLRATPMVIAMSEISRQREIYLPAEVVGEIFNFKVAWSQNEYEFQCRTDMELHVWDRARQPSLLGIETQKAPDNLPELFPTAKAPSASLDFLEIESRTELSALQNMQSQSLTIDSPRQTFWGRFLDGNYKMQFMERPVLFERSGLQPSDDAPFMISYANWKYRFRNTEVVLGDSTFGLNDITFPVVRFAGLRVNGLTRLTPGQEMTDRSQLGLRPYFLQGNQFDVQAPIGSRVELFVNDQRIDTQPVVRTSAVPGLGIYHFEEIRLPPGVLSDIRIVITDPTGIRTETRQSVMNSAALVPRGQAAYLGGFGTNRDLTNWNANGLFGGERVLYGLTDRLTVGLTTAAQQDFFPTTFSSFAGQGRPYPQQSQHLGAQLAWMALDRLLLSADSSFSQGSTNVRSLLRSMDNFNGYGLDNVRSLPDFGYNDSAYRLNANLCPVRNTMLHGQWFRYGPNFFNGGNLDLRDRQGYYVDGSWQMHRDWGLSGVAGEANDNLNSLLERTLTVNFQDIELSCRALPRTTISVQADRLTSSFGDSPRALYTLRLYATPFKDLTVYGSSSIGEALLPDDKPEFFSGLGIPRLALFQEPSTVLTATKTLSARNDVGAAYVKTSTQQRYTVFHLLRRTQKDRFQMRTELGQDIYTNVAMSDESQSQQSPFFENRSEYRLDKDGVVRIGFDLRLQQKEWTALVFLNVSGIFNFTHNQRSHLITGTSVSPERGGIHGRVFHDYNGNGYIDDGESGAPNIGVVCGNSFKTVTDQDGYYILPGLSNLREVRVWVDLDTIQATLTPTHGIQSAVVTPGCLTTVNFGIAPMNTIAGAVLASSEKEDGKPLIGVRVYLTKGRGKKVVNESVTASDGTYYLGDVKPGDYMLNVDPDSLPENFTLAEPSRRIRMQAKNEMQELELPPFQATWRKPPQPSSDSKRSI